MEEQQKAFWDVIEVFNTVGLLPHVMIIGSWAEFLYQEFYYPNFKANILTRDVDVFYHNLRRPQGQEMQLVKSMAEKGFIYAEDRLTGVGKFFNEGLLEIEFLTRALGKGNSINLIESLNLKSEGLRALDILNAHKMQLEANGYLIFTPKPEAYILHKLIINDTRSTDSKKEKDIQSIQRLLTHVDRETLMSFYTALTKKARQKVDYVCTTNFIEF